MAAMILELNTVVPRLGWGQSFPDKFDRVVVWGLKKIARLRVIPFLTQRWLRSNGRTCLSSRLKLQRLQREWGEFSE
jgi:hypothetical protein